MKEDRKVKIKRVNLTRQEKAIEDSLLKGEYMSVNKDEFTAIADAIAARKKDTVLNIRVNSRDLKKLKTEAED